jgi:hypothetical protein
MGIEKNPTNMLTQQSNQLTFALAWCSLATHWKFHNKDLHFIIIFWNPPYPHTYK